MLKVYITVSGWGGTIHHEIYPMKEFFESRGYKVSVEDDHPPTEEEMKGIGRVGKCEMVIKADHVPWGG